MAVDEDDLTGRARDLFRRAARRGRKELGRAADAGRQQLELREARRDLQAFWVRTGKMAVRLSESGELDHPSLDKAVSRIRELEARIERLERGEDPEPR